MTKRKPAGYWNEEQIHKEAAKWNGKTDLQNNCQVAYNAARRLGILESLYSTGYTTWTEEKIRRLSVGYPNKKLFALENPGASGAAYRKFPGLLDELFENKRLPMANDAIYIWRRVGAFYNNNPVYKIGVTSTRLGEWRIKLCAMKAGCEYELICCEPVVGKATNIEKKLLILGENPGYTGFDGCTEFRALSDAALYTAITIICQHMGVRV